MEYNRDMQLLQYHILQGKPSRNAQPLPDSERFSTISAEHTTLSDSRNRSIAAFHCPVAGGKNTMAFLNYSPRTGLY